MTRERDAIISHVPHSTDHTRSGSVVGLQRARRRAHAMRPFIRRRGWCQMAMLTGLV